MTHRPDPGELWLTLGGTVVFALVIFALAVGPASSSGAWIVLLILLPGLATLSCLAATVRRLVVARTVLYEWFADSTGSEVILSSPVARQRIARTCSSNKFVRLR